MKNKNDEKNKNLDGVIEENQNEEIEEEIEETDEKNTNLESNDEEKISFKKFEEEKKKHKEALANMTFEIEDIEPKYQAIVELIGCKSYKLLVKFYGGQYVYVPKLDKLIEKKKREYVYKVFIENGSDYKKTAIYCDLCITTVRKYVKEQKRAIYDKKRKEKNNKEKVNNNKNDKK